MSYFLQINNLFQLYLFYFFNLTPSYVYFTIKTHLII